MTRSRPNYLRTLRGYLNLSLETQVKKAEFYIFFNMPSDRFLDRLMTISIPERSEKPVILGSHENWAYPQKVFLDFDQLKVEIKNI